MDGNHRYVRRYRDGLNDMKAFRVPESVWVKFLIRMPPEMERLFVQTVRNSA